MRPQPLVLLDMIADGVAGRGASASTSSANKGDSAGTTGQTAQPNADTVIVNQAAIDAAAAEAFPIGDYSDSFSQIAAMAFDINLKMGGLNYAVAQQVISATPVSEGVQTSTGDFKLSGGQFDGQASDVASEISPYYYNRETGTIDYYEAGPDQVAFNRVDTYRTDLMNQRLAELNWGLGGFAAIGPLGGATLVGAVAAAPAAWTFFLSNAARISAGTGIAGEVITGVPLTVPVATGTGVAVLGAVERGAVRAGEVFRPPSFSAGPGKSYFWSGLGPGGAGTAAGVARSGGGTTLEMFIESRGIKMPVWDAANPASIKAWQDVSRVYASSASGEVRAVLGNNMRPGNIWQSVELPALKANPNVTRVITVNPTTKAETVLWSR